VDGWAVATAIVRWGVVFEGWWGAGAGAWAWAWGRGGGVFLSTGWPDSPINGRFSRAGLWKSVFTTTLFAMKYSTSLLLVLSLLAGFFVATPGRGETEEPEKPMEAKLLRSTTGRALDRSGLANGQVPVKKDEVYDVQKQTLADVTLDVEGRSVVVSTRDVLILPKKSRPAGAGSGAGAMRTLEGMKFLDKLSPKAKEKFLAEVRSHAEELKTKSPEDRKEFIKEIFLRILKEDEGRK